MEQQIPRRGNSTAKIYETLKTEILNMTLPPGDALDETSLSARFGLSRTPVREALLRLVAEGLATTLPNRNTVVTALDFEGLPQYLDALMLFYRLTCRLAAMRRTDADLALIKARQQAFSDAVARADAMGMLESNREFHLAIAMAAGNRYYTDIFGKILNEGMRLLRLYYRSFDDHLPPEFTGQHDQMIEAIRRGDADEAEKLGAGHAAQIVTQLQTFLAPVTGVSFAI